MVVYHGTTRKTAAKITRNGFQPKARRSNDRPIVLAVDLDLDALRKRYGARRDDLDKRRGPAVDVAHPLRARHAREPRRDHPLAQLHSQGQAPQGHQYSASRDQASRAVGQQQTLDQSQSRHQAEANALLHGGEQAHEWFWKGLTDPEPQAHRDIFEAALYDPHPQIAQAAQRLVRGKGYTPLKW